MARYPHERHEADPMPEESAEQRAAREEAVAVKEAEPVEELPDGPRPNTDEFVTPRLGPQP